MLHPQENSTRTTQCPGLAAGGSESLGVLDVKPGGEISGPGNPSPCLSSSCALNRQVTQCFREQTRKRRRRGWNELSRERGCSRLCLQESHGGNYISRCPEGPGEAEGSSGHRGFPQGTCFWEQPPKNIPVIGTLYLQSSLLQRKRGQ